MKVMPPTKSFHLDLSNFESSVAANCQYVLTSPRSLKACKKAGIKPVELLHRSLSDIREDLNVPPDVACSIYDQHERDRQAKIQICQNIRNRLINEEIKRNNLTKKNSLSRKEFGISRKEQLDKENLLKASSTSPSLKGNISVSSKDSELYKKQNFSGYLPNESSLSSSPVSIYSSKRNGVSPEYTSKTMPYNFYLQKLLENTSTISTSSFSPLSTPRKCSSTLPSKKYELKNSKCQFFHKKRKIKKRTKAITKSPLKEIDNDYKLFPKSLNKYHCQITNYINGKVLNSKIKHSTDHYKENIYGTTKHENLNKNRQLTKHKVSVRKKNCASLMKLSDAPKNKILDKKFNYLLRNDVCKNEKAGTLLKLVGNNEVDVKNKNSTKRGSLQNLSTNKLKRDRQLCTSTSSLGNAHPKKKEKTYAFLNVDRLKIPESDRRILETLALKKEQERECEEFSYRAHLLWEADLQKRRELDNEKKKKWQQIIEQKRKIENEENVMRMEEIKENLRLSQKILEENLLRRYEQAEKLKREAEERRNHELFERKSLESKRRAVVYANLKQKEIESSLHQKRLQQDLEERLEKAEHAREKEKEVTHRRISSANRSEALRHQENFSDVKAEKDLILEQKRREIEDKEERSKHHYFEYLRHREKHIQESRIDREMRLEIAKEMQRELDKGLEAWQDHVLLLQCSALNRASASANMNIENKRLQVECENTQRQLEHSNRWRRVKEIQDMRKEIIENAIKAKEEKIHQLLKQKEKTIEEGRIQAHTTANLREKLRRTLSPETFDRKVARAEIELRVGNRPLTASPTTMMESHIHLDH